MSKWQLIRLDKKTKQPAYVSIIDDCLDLSQPEHLQIYLNTLNSISIDEEFTKEKVKVDGSVLLRMTPKKKEKKDDIQVFNPETDEQGK